MAARRPGLFGDDARESRLTQQRDYAAQLQEQVRLKHARAEEDKARRRQEQQAEREHADALQAQLQQQQQQSRRQAQQPPPPQSVAENAAVKQSGPPSPARSPQRMQQQQQQDAEVPRSPPKAAPSYVPHWPAADASFTGGGYGGGYGGAPLVTTFASTASLFDALLPPDATSSSVAVDNQIESLQSLRLEIDAAWRQRRAALQGIASRPSFLLVPSPTASAGVPLSLDEKRLLDDEIDLSPRPEEPELTSSSGLLGDSVLIPLTAKASPSARPLQGIAAASSLSARSPPRVGSAVHRRIAAAVAAAATASPPPEPPLDATALRHDSELLHFDE